MTILLIDDDSRTTTSLSRALASNGRVLACRLGTRQDIVHRIDAEFDFDIGHDGETLRQIILRFSPRGSDRADR